MEKGPLQRSALQPGYHTTPQIKCHIKTLCSQMCRYITLVTFDRLLFTLIGVVSGLNDFNVTLLYYEQLLWNTYDFIVIPS